MIKILVTGIVELCSSIWKSLYLVQKKKHPKHGKFTAALDCCFSPRFSTVLPRFPDFIFGFPSLLARFDFCHMLSIAFLGIFIVFVRAAIEDYHFNCMCSVIVLHGMMYWKSWLHKSLGLGYLDIWRGAYNLDVYMHYRAAVTHSYWRILSAQDKLAFLV